MDTVIEQVEEPVPEQVELEEGGPTAPDLVSEGGPGSLQEGGQGSLPEPDLTSEYQEPVLDTPPPPSALKRHPRVRKVRVQAPSDTRASQPSSNDDTRASQPSSPQDPNYWAGRLQEHRSNQRAAKNERYGNLRIT
jgi:hypothetical protein